MGKTDVNEALKEIVYVKILEKLAHLRAALTQKPHYRKLMISFMLEKGVGFPQFIYSLI